MRAEHYHVSLRDVVAQFNVDTVFMNRLDRIHFTGRAVVPEAKFRQVLYEYIGVLIQMTNKPGSQDNAYLDRLDSARAEGSYVLRSALGLAPSTCAVLRP
jgi:hypothetical protein